MLSEQELIRIEQLGSTLLILAFAALIVAGEIALGELSNVESDRSLEKSLTSDEVVVIATELRVLGAFLLGVVALGRLANIEALQEGESSQELDAYRTIATGEWISTFGDYLLLIGTLNLASIGAEPTVLQ